MSHGAGSTRKEIIDISDLLREIGASETHSERLIGVGDALHLRDALESLGVDHVTISAEKRGRWIDITATSPSRSLNTTIAGSGTNVVENLKNIVASLPSLDPKMLSGWGRWQPRPN